MDAAALGAYAVVGVEKSLTLGLGLAPAMLVGVVNACGGGVLRDMFVGHRPMVFRPGQFYAMAALAGCLIYAPLRLHAGTHALATALVAMVITFGLRVLAITRDWQTPALPEKGLIPKLKRGRGRKKHH